MLYEGVKVYMCIYDIYVYITYVCVCNTEVERQKEDVYGWVWSEEMEGRNIMLNISN